MPINTNTNLDALDGFEVMPQIMLNDMNFD